MPTRSSRRGQTKDTFVPTRTRTICGFRILEALFLDNILFMVIIRFIKVIYLGFFDRLRRKENEE